MKTGGYEGSMRQANHFHNRRQYELGESHGSFPQENSRRSVTKKEKQEELIKLLKEQKLEEDRKRIIQKERLDYRCTLSHSKFLTSADIDELIDLTYPFEYGRGYTLYEQLRRYYLQLKETKGDRAEEMWQRIQSLGIDFNENISEKDIEILISVGEVYWNGLVLFQNGQSYKGGRGGKTVFARKRDKEDDQ